MLDKLKIAINAQIPPHPGTGGVESVLLALLQALGQLDGPEEYVVIGPKGKADWLAPYLGANQRLVEGIIDLGAEGSSLPLSLRARLRMRGLLRRVLAEPRPEWPTMPISNGFYESLGCQVIHFPFQYFVLCAMPTIYNPHDLQHRHYPHFFSPSLLAYREVVMRGGCQYAHHVVVGSEWIKQDVLREYQISSSKVQVVPWAVPTAVSPEPTLEKLQLVRSKFNLPQAFCLYPAATWEHKNHIRLLDALVSIRESYGLVIHLVCTGGQLEPGWSSVRARLARDNLEAQVRFLGFVPQDELRALYRLAQFVIVPTLFEAASGPVFEAWLDGAPVACSNVTSLPEQVQNAAIIFDPFSVAEIANALRSLATDESRRVELRLRGAHRLLDFSWERTARAYRAVYRRAARQPLDAQDRELLAWDWMRSPDQPGPRGGPAQ